jgi:cyclomaltodextrinase / maltogenic alpha-amylase / neopullulanase
MFVITPGLRQVNMGQDFIFGVTSFSDYIVTHRQEELRTIWHNYRIEPVDPAPGQPVELTVYIGTGYGAQAVYCYWTTEDEQPYGRAGKASCGQVMSLTQTGPVWEDLIWGYVSCWKGFLPPQPDGTRVRYRLEAWDELLGISAFADNGSPNPLQNPPFVYHVDHWHSPDWIRDAVIYQVLVDRFYPGDGQDWKDTANLSGIVGGTLRGVIERLPYFTNLGINTLWISPISEGPGWHHYNTTDHRQVAAHLGTNQDFHELVEKAHAAGIRILLDFVVHATSDEHSFLKAAQKDHKSPYFPWYTFSDWPEEYDCFFNVKALPHLNLEYPPARQYIIDSALQWLVDYGVDGFRLDYAIKPSHDFWVALQSALRSAVPDCFNVAEAVASPAQLRTFEGKLDGCLDFTFADAIRSTFGFQKNKLAGFANFLERHENYPDPNFIRPTFIDNHDMNRFLFIAGGDKRKVKLAAACQFTLSQPPIVLYGTEAGVIQKVDAAGDLDVVREPMLWDQDQDPDLLQFYRKLCAVRNRYSALRRGIRTTVFVDEDTLVYSKGSGSDTCLVALHLGEDQNRLQVEVKEDIHRRLVDVLSGTRYIRNQGHIDLELEPWQACILVPEEG